MGLFRREPEVATSSPYDDWPTRDTVYDHLNDLLQCWAGQHGFEWRAPGGWGTARTFGVCTGVHEGVRFDIRGTVEHSRSRRGHELNLEPRHLTEVRAWVPEPGARIRKLTRSHECGPYEPARIGALYKGDVAALSDAAVEALVAAAPYSTILRLDHEDADHRRAPGGVVFVSPWDPRLHPGSIEWAGVDLLLGSTVGVARALAG
jgi:hypothetical protein